MGRVLGIDAAWTPSQPSGLALVAEAEGKWKLLATAPSYDHFIALSQCRTIDGPPKGSVPNVVQLLDAAATLAGGKIDLIAVDMPLSREPITCRRASDDLVSRAYGSRHCSTHTPSATRPGRISDDLREAFDTAGYPLLTTMGNGGLCEVYPHPALVELARAPRRLPYKISKIRNYWPDDIPAVRREKLIEQWAAIVSLLDLQLLGTADQLQPPPLEARTVAFKAFEDRLDAVVCAWVGISVLCGTADPFGDATSAIWIPRSDMDCWISL